MDNNLNDPKNIAGLSGLLKDSDIDSNIDLAELEREISAGASSHQVNDINVADEYRKEMERMTRNFDIGMTVKETTSSNQYMADADDDADDDEASQIIINDSKFNDTSSRFGDSSNNNKKSDIISRSVYNSPITNTHEYEDNQLNRMTMEEKKQDKINQVLHDIDDKELEFNIEKEKDEDDKASLLEQIDMLTMTLEDDGINISGVPTITKNSSMKDVHTVYKILRLKNDRNRYCSFAEELILSGAYGIEYLFDGKKEWFYRRPDLTGWSSTVKVKLRRMRFETSTFVQEVMQEYNMSAGMRLALELLPSMFLYSRNRRLSQDDNLVSNDDYKNAISKLNSL